MGEQLVVMSGIEKRFAGVHALKGCRFELRSGEVHALVGENGAGKSTMMKILTGVYQRDEGEIAFRGRPADLPDTRAAQKLGISMIHQELNLAPDLTVAQNIYIGREPRRLGGILLDDKRLNRQAEQLLRRMNLDIAPDVLVSDLTVAKQQMVEIVKAISYESQVLIMDEPTAALSDAEIEELFIAIGKLRASGVGIVYISHRMAELQRICDRITVMRDGSCIDTVLTKETTIEKIIAMMVGRELYHSATARGREERAEVVLEVKGLNRGKAIKNVSFQLRRGEILGMAGLIGAGRTEVARALFGADPVDSGDIYVQGRKVRIMSPHHAVREGIGYLSEDRKRYGCLVDMDVKSNVAVSSFKRFSRFSWMLKSPIERAAEDVVGSLQVKTPSIHQALRNLSGGNQQKVIIGKWLTKDCDILIFDEPTRGIDIGAKSEIYKLLDRLAGQGKAILMISSELPEILRLSHRVLVMCEGRVTADLRNAEGLSQETIMQYATRREDRFASSREETLLANRRGYE
ncbi:sugar ABC transporter ATP-binding protein [Paenibacillus glycinis]|uniref:ATP-binding cassette domain-containing protein n=1 Tax=Paenibacillus glycinis TaxID=2697035 RepID=A0ABW9XML2_9BACL|nr:sugar ABC transporter ATP-binding protein [Paenibacillus glycinis]NBD23873.1 ATP-binding cassette domain-containing protein [Paenibacillus glycinis]